MSPLFWVNVKNWSKNKKTNEEIEFIGALPHPTERIRVFINLDGCLFFPCKGYPLQLLNRCYVPVENEINDYHNNYSVIVEKPVCIKYFFVLRVMSFYAKSFEMWLLTYLMILFIQLMIYFNFNYTWHFKLITIFVFWERKISRSEWCKRLWRHNGLRHVHCGYRSLPT